MLASFDQVKLLSKVPALLSIHPTHCSPSSERKQAVLPCSVSFEWALSYAIDNADEDMLVTLFNAFILTDKFWYCRLSPNHKVLHYGDLEESPQGEVPHDSLQDKCKSCTKIVLLLLLLC